MVVFVTAYDEFAIRAFEARALDYLLKPVSQKRLDDALTRAAARVRDRKLAEYGRTLLDAVAELQRGSGTETGPPAPAGSFLERIMVKAGDAIQFVEVANIDWVEGADYYVTLHTGGKEFLYRESLKHLEARLDPSQFVRIHQSAIVNLARAREIRRGFGGEVRRRAQLRNETRREPPAEERPPGSRRDPVRAERLTRCRSWPESRGFARPSYTVPSRSWSRPSWPCGPSGRGT